MFVYEVAGYHTEHGDMETLIIVRNPDIADDILRQLNDEGEVTKGLDEVTRKALNDRARPCEDFFVETVLFYGEVV